MHPQNDVCPKTEMDSYLSTVWFILNFIQQPRLRCHSFIVVIIQRLFFDSNIGCIGIPKLLAN